MQPGHRIRENLTAFYLKLLSPLGPKEPAFRLFEGEVDMGMFGLQLTTIHTGHLKDPSGGDKDRLTVVFVREKDDFPNADLNDEFGTLITGEKRNVNARTFEFGLIRGIGDGVHLGVADVGILGIEEITLAVPRQGVIGAPDRKTVITDPDYSIPAVDDTGADLRGWVFGALGGELGNRHEILFPADIIGPFRCCHGGSISNCSTFFKRDFGRVAKSHDTISCRRQEGIPDGSQKDS